MSETIKYQIKTIQSNTGKEARLNLEKPYMDMSCSDARRQLAKVEHVPLSSIQLVDYDLHEFDFSVVDDTKVLISNVYTNNIVKY
jgi:hypothetical protein